jgi:RecJ-like exonuclease
MKCPHCDGGSIAVEPGSSQRYRCPDCGGTGVKMKPCDECGRPTPANDDDTCEECQDEEAMRPADLWHHRHDNHWDLIR